MALLSAAVRPVMLQGGRVRLPRAAPVQRSLAAPASVSAALPARGGFRAALGGALPSRPSHASAGGTAALRGGAAVLGGAQP